MAYLLPILLYVALLALCAKPKRTQRTWEPLLLSRNRQEHPQPAAPAARDASNRSTSRATASITTRLWRGNDDRSSPSPGAIAGGDAMTTYVLWMLSTILHTPEGILLAIGAVGFVGYRLLYKPYERAFPYKRF
jgi:hypothetical protein